jgi:hypothetical protein
MAELHLDLTVPVGDAGHVHLDIRIADLGELTPGQRQVLADTAREFCEFGAATIAPPMVTMADIGPARPGIHDPDAAVLDGVRGSRVRDKL